MGCCDAAQALPARCAPPHSISVRLVGVLASNLSSFPWLFPPILPQKDLSLPVLVILGIVPFNVDLRYAMTHQYLKELRDTFQEKVTTPVRTDAAIPKAQAYKQSIFEYAPESKAAQDIRTLAEQLFLRRSPHAKTI